MTLNQIAAEIDTLLERFMKARAILATLAPETGPTVEERVERMQRARVAEAEAPATKLTDGGPVGSAGEGSTTPAPATERRASRTVRTVSIPGSPRAARRHTHTPQATALRGTIPNGPVVISADAVRSRATPQAVPREPQRQSVGDPGHSLDDLVRELTRRSHPLSSVPPSSV